MNSHLGDAQQARETFKSADFRAAGQVGPASGEREDVGKGAGTGGSPEEDEIWGDSLRRAAGDDAIVLWEVGYKDAEEDES